MRDSERRRARAREGEGGREGEGKSERVRNRKGWVEVSIYSSLMGRSLLLSTDLHRNHLKAKEFGQTFSGETALIGQSNP